MDSSANYICSNLILQSFEKDEHTISEINSALKTFSDIVNFSSVRNDRNAKKILKFDSARSPKPSAQHLETLSELADIADFDMLNKFPLYFEPLNNYIRDSTNPRDVNREESSCFSKETKDTKYRYSTDEKQSSEGSKQSQSVLGSYLDVEWDQQLKPERVLPKISDHLLLGHRSVETQTRVLVKVLNQSNSPNMPSNGAEFVFSEDSTWPKQIGSPNKIKADISISASSTVTLSLTNKQLHIKESATEFPGWKVLMSEKQIESSELFWIGSTIFNLSIDSDNNLTVKNLNESFEKITKQHVLNTGNSCLKLIGRSRTSDFCYSEDIKMSKTHAVIENRGGKWFLKDRNSRNGVWNYLHTNQSLLAMTESREISLINNSMFAYLETMFEVKIY